MGKFDSEKRPDKALYVNRWRAAENRPGGVDGKTSWEQLLQLHQEPRASRGGPGFERWGRGFRNGQQWNGRIMNGANPESSKVEQLHSVTHVEDIYDCEMSSRTFVPREMHADAEDAARMREYRRLLGAVPEGFESGQRRHRTLYDDAGGLVRHTGGIQGAEIWEIERDRSRQKMENQQRAEMIARRTGNSGITDEEKEGILLEKSQTLFNMFQRHKASHGASVSASTGGAESYKADDGGLPYRGLGGEVSGGAGESSGTSVDNQLIGIGAYGGEPWLGGPERAVPTLELRRSSRGPVAARWPGPDNSHHVDGSESSSSQHLPRPSAARHQRNSPGAASEESNDRRAFAGYMAARGGAMKRRGGGGAVRSPSGLVEGSGSHHVSADSEEAHHRGIPARSEFLASSRRGSHRHMAEQQHHEAGQPAVGTDSRHRNLRQNIRHRQSAGGHSCVDEVDGGGHPSGARSPDVGDSFDSPNRSKEVEALWAKIVDSYPSPESYRWQEVAWMRAFYGPLKAKMNRCLGALGATGQGLAQSKMAGDEAATAALLDEVLGNISFAISAFVDLLDRLNAKRNKLFPAVASDLEGPRGISHRPETGFRLLPLSAFGRLFCEEAPASVGGRPASAVALYADSAACHVMAILGDLHRYCETFGRDPRAPQRFRELVKESLSLKWYFRSMRSRPYDGTAAHKVSVGSRESNVDRLAIVHWTFRSVIAARSSPTRDILTAQLQTLALHCKAQRQSPAIPETFGAAAAAMENSALPLVQTLYSGVDLDTFHISSPRFLDDFQLAASLLVEDPRCDILFSITAITICTLVNSLRIHTDLGNKEQLQLKAVCADFADPANAPHGGAWRYDDFVTSLTASTVRLVTYEEIAEDEKARLALQLILEMGQRLIVALRTSKTPQAHPTFPALLHILTYLRNNPVLFSSNAPLLVSFRKELAFFTVAVAGHSCSPSLHGERADGTPPKVTADVLKHSLPFDAYLLGLVPFPLCFPPEAAHTLFQQHNGGLALRADDVATAAKRDDSASASAVPFGSMPDKSVPADTVGSQGTEAWVVPVDDEVLFSRPLLAMAAGGEEDFACEAAASAWDCWDADVPGGPAAPDSPRRREESGEEPVSCQWISAFGGGGEATFVDETLPSEGQPEWDPSDESVTQISNGESTPSRAKVMMMRLWTLCCDMPETVDLIKGQSLLSSTEAQVFASVNGTASPKTDGPYQAKTRSATALDKFQSPHHSDRAGWASEPSRHGRTPGSETELPSASRAGLADDLAEPHLASTAPVGLMYPNEGDEKFVRNVCPGTQQVLQNIARRHAARMGGCGGSGSSSCGSDRLLGGGRGGQATRADPTQRHQTSAGCRERTASDQAAAGLRRLYKYCSETGDEARGVVSDSAPHSDDGLARRGGGGEEMSSAAGSDRSGGQHPEELAGRKVMDGAAPHLEKVGAEVRGVLRGVKLSGNPASGDAGCEESAGSGGKNKRRMRGRTRKVGGRLRRSRSETPVSAGETMESAVLGCRQVEYEAFNRRRTREDSFADHRQGEVDFGPTGGEDFNMESGLLMRRFGAAAGGANARHRQLYGGATDSKGRYAGDGATGLLETLGMSGGQSRAVGGLDLVLGRGQPPNGWLHGGAGGGHKGWNERSRRRSDAAALPLLLDRGMLGRVARPAGGNFNGTHDRLPMMLQEPRRPLIAIDGSNVAMRHGGMGLKGEAKRFSCLGIKIAIEYYLQQNYEVVAFVPEYVTKVKEVGGNRRLKISGLDVAPSRLPDDVSMLLELAHQKHLVLTPPQDYDDSYIIKYALNRDGCILTNDLYRDFVDKCQNKALAQKWLKSHLISFTFISDEFLPNPDFEFPPPWNGGEVK